MASKLCKNRALAAALRPAKPTSSSSSSVALRSNDALLQHRAFTTTARLGVVHVPKDAPNPRAIPRGQIGPLKAPPVNPADKYQAKADDLHKYGAWLMSCLPKYIQQFSVWKDELTIYISPSGVIPVFSFLKCKRSSAPS
jgi:NADH dehydrogenase (ubiquinone) Fe-S protein 3